jgi:hypothetical protein
MQFLNQFPPEIRCSDDQAHFTENPLGAARGTTAWRVDSVLCEVAKPPPCEVGSVLQKFLSNLLSRKLSQKSPDCVASRESVCLRLRRSRFDPASDRNLLFGDGTVCLDGELVSWREYKFVTVHHVREKPVGPVHATINLPASENKKKRQQAFLSSKRVGSTV